MGRSKIMTEVNMEDLRIRQFLLGDLGPREREELEQLVLIGGETREKLLMAEDDLIEEYLEGTLPGEEREKFLRQFLSIPHQRNKLRIAKSLRRFARDEANIETVPIKPRALRETDIDTVPIEPRALTEADIDTVPIKPPPFVARPVVSFPRKLVVYMPIAAVILVAVTIGIVLYLKYRGSVEHEAQIQAIERELAQVNAPEEQNMPADQVSTLIVPPFSPRSVVASSSSGFKGPMLELRLLPTNRQTETYNAVLQKIGSEDKYRIPNLRAHDRDGERAVRLRIPTRLLSPGTYRVQLTGLTTSGPADTEEFNFEIQ